MKLSTPTNNDPIMSEFDELRPSFFYHQEDDLPPSSPTYGACLSEEIWKKFELLPTPPRSPEHFNPMDSDPDPAFESAMNDIDFSIIKDSVDDLSPVQSQTNLNQSSNLANKQDQQANDSDMSYNKLIKDCMWNGFGHKPHSEVSRNGRLRNSSPGSQRYSAATGCVDPRTVFTINSTCEVRRLSPVANMSTKKRIDSIETTSDSDEEIDVVTVDKANPKNTTRTTTLGVVSQGRKYVGTLVARQNGKHRQLELVTTGLNRLQDNKTPNEEQNRGRSKAKVQIEQVTTNGQKKTLMIVKNRNVVSVKSNNQKSVNVQVKRLPVVTTSRVTDTVASKRRYSNPEDCGKNVTQVMRMTTPSSLMGINEHSKENDADVAAPVGKRRILSLDGVSMVSNTGVMQHRTELANKLNAFANTTNPSLASDLPSLKSLKPVQTIKTERIYTTTVSDKRKYIKKNKTKIVLDSFDTPACSPASSNGDVPNSPEKPKIGVENGTTSSSGSDEELIRFAHNVLERQRREGLRSSFHTLRKFVPELSTQERAPKVTILKKARDYCFQLHEDHVQLQNEKSRLQQRQLSLQQRLRALASEISSVKSITIPSRIKCEQLVNVEPAVTYLVQEGTSPNSVQENVDEEESLEDRTFYQNSDSYSDYDAEISGEEQFNADTHLKGAFTNVYQFC